nr:PREDICTED: 2-acylglycerol O-acyltransferase 1-like isoform X1 [Tribolium castaneum]|eukprot:XP_015840891.1 PREDICTED: 2-acylglycerol O-acyltransferase 1-like isoform X1 [Tribolium castaneum]
MRICGLNFDVWNTTFEKKVQIILAGGAYFTVVYSGIILVIFCLYLLFTPFWWLVLLYLSWLFLDRHTPSRGSRTIKFLDKLMFWKYIHNHFLTNLRLTPDFELSPNQNYLFACFPHGVVPMGLHATIVNPYSKFRNLYPKFHVKVATVSFYFLFPILRDITMAVGFISCSFKSLVSVLSDPKGGEIVVLLPGGVLESSYNQYQPQRYQCVIKHKKGFVKAALTSGAALVPVLTFGENDLLAVEGSFWQRFNFITKHFPTLALGFFHGRGIFQNYFGMVPRKTPLMTVVGTPIPVSKTENPSDEQIDALHTTFQKELVKLFEKYKYQFFVHPQGKHLEFA